MKDVGIHGNYLCMQSTPLVSKEARIEMKMRQFTVYQKECPNINGKVEHNILNESGIKFSINQPFIESIKSIP